MTIAVSAVSFTECRVTIAVSDVSIAECAVTFAVSHVSIAEATKKEAQFRGRMLGLLGEGGNVHSGQDGLCHVVRCASSAVLRWGRKKEGRPKTP